MPSTGPTQTMEPADIGSVFISNYPPYGAWRADAVADALAALRAPAGPDTPLGLYLHIPFCRTRCKFCYFKVYTDKDGSQVRRYASALAREVSLYGELPGVAGRPLSFIYFGGGTPSYISSRELKALMSAVRAAMPCGSVEEITFECEPGTLTAAKVAAIREEGVTRLSLGVENFNDEILRENGRAHQSAEIYRVLPWIRAQGFEQLNVDLIAGMVGETWETWRDSVSRCVDAAPDSVTIYQMELPYNTLYSRDLMGGRGDLPAAGWELKRQWHAHAVERLESSGYEISSAYTMRRRGSGARFVYRDSVWRGCDLIGTGVASFSHLGGVHFQNTPEWEQYLGGIEQGRLPLARALRITPAERLTREVILQLKTGRLDEGWFRAKFHEEIGARFGAVFESLKQRGMLRPEPGRLELTRQGLLMVDHLLPEFYAPEHREARYT